MWHFYAYMARMKHIQRWGLMRNSQPENILEHTAQVAMIAHALAVLRNQGGGEPVDLGKVALLALYHDASEVITGDLATPIKYFDPEITAAYQRVEDIASHKLLDMLPQALRPAYAPLLLAQVNTPERQLVKAADRLAAYLKCIEELKAGNAEFAKAGESILKSLKAMALPEVEAFLLNFAPSFSLTLDEMG